MLSKKIIQEGNINIYVEVNNGVINILSKREIPDTLCSLPNISANEVIGRDNDVKSIAALLNSSNKVVLVNGLGGIGKTTVAKLFLNQLEHSYKHLAWIDVSKGVKEAFVYNNELVDSLILDIDREIEDEDSIDYSFDVIINRMRELKGNNLLIIDNVGRDLESENVLRKIALKPYWKVLVTSRQKLNGFMSYNLDFLSEDDAKKLFLLHYKGEYEEKDLVELLELIGYHTLTIELLAKTLEINFSFDGIKDLINYLKNRDLDDKELEVLVNISHSKEEVMIYTHLMKAFSLADLTEIEKKILLYFSILPSIDINGKELVLIFKTENAINLSNNLNNLVKKGWLLNNERHKYKCHQIIQEIIRYKFDPNPINCKNIVDFFSDYFFVKVGKNPLNKKKYLPFGESVLSVIDENSENIGSLNDNLAKTLRYFGYNDKAINYAMRSIEIREQVLPSYHKDLGNSYVNTAVIQRYLGRYNDALEYGLKALNFFNSQKEKNYISIATAYYKITLTYIKLKNYEKAMEYSHLDLDTLDEAKELKQMTDSQEVYFAETYNTRGEILRKMNDYENALKFKLDAIRIREEKLEKNHPDLAISYHHTSLTYFDAQNYLQAKEYIDKAVNIRKAILPEDHSDLIESIEWQEKIENKLGLM